jgi:hypothetical protein
MSPDERRELEEYYGELIKMFNSKGWEYFLQDIQDSIDYQRLDDINSLEELHQAKGRITAGRNILALQASVEAARESLDESNS